MKFGACGNLFLAEFDACGNYQLPITSYVFDAAQFDAFGNWEFDCFANLEFEACGN